MKEGKTDRTKNENCYTSVNDDHYHINTYRDRQRDIKTYKTQRVPKVFDLERFIVGHKSSLPSLFDHLYLYIRQKVHFIGLKSTVYHSKLSLEKGVL